ncbi:TM2 domain protein [Clostridium tepidiprofundi DSM 19306]|uniref:TM2 domain protein n=1 Tax=Clostridium tepidiprofundi DSM 19306 TaxID=1121338 RepID=A0A151B294_9CLOT|nr:TM2 domain-containing protein [Clostridium tepidiprofundi]KYH34041.1 TM2 domain protein [Clostridium tepidiprofundi DSM 19306]
MHCYIHNDRPAIGTCVGCGKFICEECKTEIGGKYYCKNCVERLFNENKKRIEKLEEKSEQKPMIFMNAGGGGGASSSSSSSSAGGLGNITPICDKNKVLAALLAIFLGGVGVHKFYLGKIGMGILYLIFCWTGIPAIIGVIEGIILLCTSEQDFARKYGHY